MADDRRKQRVMQIGTGGFGLSWMEVVNDFPETELVAVVDVNLENLAKAKERLGLPDHKLYTDPDQALQEVSTDIALIVTPPKTHKELILKALSYGCHVMVEKPMTHTYEDAIDLLHECQQYDQQVMVSQNYRWRPVIQTLRNKLREGVIGNIGYIEYEFRKAMKFGGWRDQYTEILLEDMSIHHFDIMRFLLGKEAEEVFAQSYRPTWSWFNGNPSAGVMIRFADNIYVNYFGSWVSRGKETTWDGDIRIVGDQGALELIDNQIVLWRGDGTEAVGPTAVELAQMPFGDRATSLNELVQAIRGNRTPATSIEDNIYSFELTCCAIQSATIGQKVELAKFSKIQR